MHYKLKKYIVKPALKRHPFLKGHGLQLFLNVLFHGFCFPVACSRLGQWGWSKRRAVDEWGLGEKQELPDPARR